MFWIIFLPLLLVLLIWLLCSPIYLQIEWNEDYQFAQLHWWGILRGRLLPERGDWTFRLELPLFSRSWPISKWQPGTKKEQKNRAKSTRKKSWKPKHPLQLVRRLWRSFHLIRLRVDLDTDDYVWNAYLFPLFRVTNPAGRKDWRINFKGRNELSLIVENRLYRLLYAFIRTVV